MLHQSLQIYHYFFEYEWMVAVRQPLSNSEIFSSLACSYRNLFKIKMCLSTSGPSCILIMKKSSFQYFVIEFHILNKLGIETYNLVYLNVLYCADLI
jgi:hypothetical protein